MPRGSILTPGKAIEAARNATTVAVLGIKPESKASQPAFFVPKAIQLAGKRVIPVPVFFPEATEILGEPVQRDLKLIKEDVDILDVFRPGSALPSHLADVLALRPRVVWLQVVIRNDAFEEGVLGHGIDLVVDRCLKVDLQDASSKL